MISLKQATNSKKDIDFLQRCFGSPDIMGCFQRTRVPGHETLRKRIVSQAENRKYLFLIVRGVRYIGFGYADRSRAFDHYEIGITIIPGMRRRGYGLQAHRLLLDYVIIRLKARRLVAYVSTGNKAERKVLASCSFVHEGTMRQAGVTRGVIHDIAIYGILKSEKR